MENERDALVNEAPKKRKKSLGKKEDNVPRMVAIVSSIRPLVCLRAYISLGFHRKIRRRIVGATS